MKREMEMKMKSVTVRMGVCWKKAVGEKAFLEMKARRELDKRGWIKCRLWMGKIINASRSAFSLFPRCSPSPNNVNEADAVG